MNTLDNKEEWTRREVRNAIAVLVGQGYAEADIKKVLAELLRGDSGPVDGSTFREYERQYARREADHAFEDALARVEFPVGTLIEYAHSFDYSTSPATPRMRRATVVSSGSYLYVAIRAHGPRHGVHARLVTKVTQ